MFVLVIFLVNFIGDILVLILWVCIVSVNILFKFYFFDRFFVMIKMNDLIIFMLY